MSKIFKRLFDILLIIIIIALCSYFVLRNMGQLLIYSVKTGSMEDNIHVGDYILIMKKDNYSVGDVITYKKNDGFITHRIVKKNGNDIITKGDANNIEDDMIDKNSVVGKVIISGGVLNIIIKFKYTITGLLLSLYLLSCYFSKDQEDTFNENTADLKVKIELKDHKKDSSVKKTKANKK